MYITILVKQIYWYISQVSGERLQDHWSSGFFESTRISQGYSVCSRVVPIVKLRYCYVQPTDIHVDISFKAKNGG